MEPQNSISIIDIISQKKNPIPFCLNCGLIPIFSVKNENIQITCKCGENNEIKINDYLRRIDTFYCKHNCNSNGHSNIKAIMFCFKCEKWLCNKCMFNHNQFAYDHHTTFNNDMKIKNCKSHNNKDREYYCKECNDYLCSFCKDVHKESHECIHIPSFTSQINTREIKEILDVGKDYIENYFPQLKERIRKKIERLYSESYNKFKNIIKLYIMIYECYNSNNSINNYNVLKNISNINLKFKKLDEDKDDYIQFLKNNNITISKLTSEHSYYNNKTNKDYTYYSMKDTKFKTKSSFMIDTLKLKKTINGNNSPINSLCVLKDGRLASCSGDMTIKIYDPNNSFHLDLTIPDTHNSFVITICTLDDKKIASCAVDSTIKIWKINGNSYNSVSTLTGHNDSVNKVVSLPNNQIASCCKDATIKIWNSISPYQCIKTITEHTEPIYSLLLMSNNKYLLSGSWDFSLGVWNAKNFQNEKRIFGVYCYIWNSLIEIDSDRVAVGGAGTVSIVNISISMIEQTIENINEQFVFSLLLLKNGNLLIGVGEGTLYLFDPKERKVTKKDRCHNSSLNCILNLNDNIISCSDDGTIKIWEV